MIEKQTFCQAIESIEQQHAKDKINSKLVQEAFSASEDFLYDTAILQKQIIDLLRIWFPKDEDGFCVISHFCYFENFGKLNNESIEEFYNKIIKEKSICNCKTPNPQMKNSENGIFSYCGKCLKEYKLKTK